MNEEKRELRAIVCPPRWYKLPAVENVHMDVNLQPNDKKAWDQWGVIVNLCEMSGMKVFLIMPQENLYSMVFAANGAWGYYNQKECMVETVVANFRNPTRQGEKEYYKKLLKRLGCNVWELPEGLFFEGQGDAVTTHETYCIASGIRSDAEARKYITRIMQLPKPVTPITLVDKRFYHLDTCMMSLPARNALIYFPDAFDQESLERIRSFCLERFEVNEKLALSFVCNSVFIHDMVLLNVPFPDITARSYDLSAEGKLLTKDDFRFEEIMENEPSYEEIIRYLWDLKYNIIPVFTSEFRKSGAGVRCLILFI